MKILSNDKNLSFKIKPSIYITLTLFQLQLFLIQISVAHSQTDTLRCIQILTGKSPLDSQSSGSDEAKAWAKSQASLNEILSQTQGLQLPVEAIVSTILAKEFVLTSGGPGAGKTMILRKIYQAVLDALPDQKQKLFIIQLNKMTSENKITGVRIFDKIWNDGKVETNFEDSLASDDVLFFIGDEIDKATSSFLTTLFSPLNERRVFGGSGAKTLSLQSGGLTSNKSPGTPMNINSEVLGALLDRVAVKIVLPNQQETIIDTVKMIEKRRFTCDSPCSPLPLLTLQKLIDKVQIPDSIMSEIVSILREFDRYITGKSNKSDVNNSRDFKKTDEVPANQFSTRSFLIIIKLFKASIISSQLMQGVPFDKIRYIAQRSDIPMVLKSALYNGTENIKFKSYPLTENSLGVSIRTASGTSIQLSCLYSPYDSKIILQDSQGVTQLEYAINSDGSFVKTYEGPLYKGSEIQDNQETTRITQLIGQLKSTMDINVDYPQFEIEGKTQRLQSRRTIRRSMIGMLDSIQEDWRKMIDILNSFLGKPPIPFIPSNNLNQRRTDHTVKEWKAHRRNVRKIENDEDKIKENYSWMVHEIATLTQRFPELDHAIEAILTSLLSHNHALFFGPPGAAKSLMARIIFKAALRNASSDLIENYISEVIRTLNIDERNPENFHFLSSVLKRMKERDLRAYDLFILQFNKQLPQGLLTGFSKGEELMRTGKEIVEVGSSLANKKFIYAILDELPNANPQTLNLLLSILNERSIFNGNQTLKIALRTAISTSNKMVPEFMDAYEDDVSSAEATLDRILNKVFFPNKPSNEDILIQFLLDFERHLNSEWNGVLPIESISKLVDQVTYDNPIFDKLLVIIHDRFMSNRIQVEEESNRNNQRNSRVFPYRYVSANSSIGNRTIESYILQLKSRFIVNQIMNNVPIENLRLNMELSDLHLFFEGMG